MSSRKMTVTWYNNKSLQSQQLFVPKVTLHELGVSAQHPLNSQFVVVPLYTLLLGGQGREVVSA